MMLSQMMCEATRWCSIVLLADKRVETILDYILMQWVSLHGPMKLLITDSESALGGTVC